MASISGSKKRVKRKEISHLSKKQCNITQIEEQEEQEPQWISNTGKTITPYKKPLQQKLRNGVADWIVTDGLPFNTVREKSFKRMINNINPAFIPPCYATLKRDIGCEYKTAVELMKSYIEETCIYASITTDLWTSRAKTGYIGITYHWLTQEMKLCDILVCVEKISYSHTRTHIRETIQEKLKVLGLEKKVNVAVTDNGSNMVKAINEWDDVSRVACSAYTLQLCMFKGLKKIKPYPQRYAKLNQFFESPKQTERLKDAQREIIRQEE
ncbi:unnamed protein product [Rhizophagus irregularis]|nr:unnamed protein product [Rhizophagus irregularis]